MSFATGDEKRPAPSTSSSVQCSKPCRHLEFSEILTTTEDFDESLVIGKGGFGKVYKGKIINGASRVVAAIKRLDPESSQGEVEFWAEVEMLSMLRHPNIVSLIGYCIHEHEKILVYEYMSKRTLEDHLHESSTPLSWLRRLNICIDAGCGLRYLHNETGMDSGVIHRDVKSSNILLHENWAAKVSDFGLSKTCPTNQPSTYVKTRVKGSYGKSDVYAFGVVLVEILCRKRAVDTSLGDDQWSLVAWVQDSVKEVRLKHIIDSDIRGETYPKCLKGFPRLADRCLHNNPRQRSTKVEAVASLENVQKLRGRINNNFGNKGNNGVSHFQSPGPGVKLFKFTDLEKATIKFSPNLLLGEGDYVSVFLGWVKQNTLAPSKHGDGIAVAVTRITSNDHQAVFEWQTELNILGQLAHPNIVSLLGYCKDELEYLLVYEYMPNKSLDHFLFKADVAKPLSWRTRLLIMKGVARGLTYLHLIKQIIHCDLTSANILLDEDFNPKLGGFGLAKYNTNTSKTLVPGTFGYLDPEYFKTGHLTMKSDIYSFGVVLLESMIARRAWDDNMFEMRTYLLDWVTDQVQSYGRNVKEIMDPRLEDNYPLQGASECFALALRCVADNSKDRPSSEEVFRNLEQIYGNLY
ncbi:putative protein kinase RLK-Pelle-RLCK-VIIa-2 family [Helianthus anomalus]